MPSVVNKKYSYLASNVTITCNGADREEPFAYEISTLGYGEAHQALKADEISMLKGRLIATNATNLLHQVLIFEPSRSIKVGHSDTFTEALHDSTAVTGLGIIKTTETLIEKSQQSFHKGEDSSIPKLTTILVVRHADWHPLVSSSFLSLCPDSFLTYPLLFSQLSRSVEFEVEYRCQPRGHLRGTPAILLPGREVMFNGFIIDFCKPHKRWIVEVSPSLFVFLLSTLTYLPLPSRSPASA